jgi:lipid-A-disaccharide synthase
VAEQSSGLITLGLLAGEASGDSLGAGLMMALKEQYGGTIRFIGVGGPRMEAQGLECLADFDALSVNGFKEPILRLPALLGLYRSLARTFIDECIDAFVGIDFNVFNFLLEARLKRAGIATAHYVSPSVYAWRRGRTKKVARCADKVFCLFPFEPALYENHDVDARFVGHPLAREITPEAGSKTAQAKALKQLGLETQVVTLALLPGSRSSEVALMLQPMLDAAAGLASSLEGQGKRLQVVIPCLTQARLRQIQSISCNMPNLVVHHVLGDARQCLVACDVTLVKSGTSTLEAMLVGRPMVVTYRLNTLSYWIVRMLVSTPYIAIPNILAGRMLVPELVQDAATPDAMCQALQEQLAVNSVSPTAPSPYAEIHAALSAGESGQGANVGAALGVIDLLRKKTSEQDSLDSRVARGRLR